MILDLAYILRNRLRKLGYSAADVVGLLFVPPDDPQIDYPPLMRINTVAALTELNHYTRPGNVFHSYYDDRHAFLRDPEPPFARLAVLPAPPPSVSSATPPVATTPPRGGWSGSRPYPVKDFRSGTLHHSSTSLANSGIQRQVLRSLADGTLSETPKDAVLAAADWTRLELFGSLGRIAAESRPAPPAADVPTTFCTWGMARFEWPRNEVVTRTARIISGVMLDQWVSPDPGRAREIVPNWTANLWQQVGLDLEGFIERLKHAANQAVQGDAETMLVQIGETAIPKGWLARTPDAAQVGHALVQWDQRVGRPIAGQNSPSTPIDDALRVAASDLATMAQSELSAAVPRLIDDPKFRLAGAEEAARQLIADLDRMASAMAEQADRLEGEAAAYYEVLSSHAYNTRLIRPASGSLVESLKQYPRLRYQALLARRAARTYAALKEALATVKNEVANCRQRLLGFKTALLGEIEQPSPEPGPRQVLPPGCGSIEDAAKKYLDVLTDDDLHQMEDWVQNGVERNYGGLYQACLNSAEGAQSLLTVLRNQTRAYLNARLGEVDLAAMFTQKYGPTPLICEAFRSAYADAHPDLITSGPWTRQAITIFAAPTGDAGDPLRHAACLAIPSTGTIFAEAPDEAVIYCEFPQVPLAALPHFGPAWQSAYDSAFDTLQCTPHTRIDVAQWTGIDAE